MARTFDGNTANRLTGAFVPVSTYPITFLAHVKLNSTSGEKTIIRIGRTSGGQAADRTIVLGAFDNQFYMMSGVNGAFQPALSGTVSSGTTYRVAGVCTGPTFRRCYVDGVGGTADTDSQDWTDSTLHGTQIGVWAQADGTFVNPMDGDISEVWCYNAALTDEEIAAWAAGTISPWNIRPGSVRGYWVCDGTGDEENQATDKTFTLTKTGTVGQGTHPTVTAFQKGALSILLSNQRYFTRDGERPLVLGGSHFQQSLMDRGSSFPPSATDWKTFIDDLAVKGHNFTRLWVWDMGRPGDSVYYAPLPFSRTGPGNGADGQLKFDFNTYDSSFFTRLRDRIRYAGEKGVYVSIMLFEGWEARFTEAAWIKNGHPFTSGNNINSISADQNANGTVEEVYALTVAGITTIQDNYIKKVIDETHDLYNVVAYEPCNEADNITNAHDWQGHIASVIRAYQVTKPATYRPLVWRTSTGSGVNDESTLQVQGDILAPSSGFTGYSASPNFDSPIAPAASLPRIYDSDHIDTELMTSAGFWKAFTRGAGGLAFMDDPGGFFGFSAPYPDDLIRKNIGWILAYSKVMNLAKHAPSSTLSSTTYCLAYAPYEYLVFQPSNGAFTVDLSAASGLTLFGEWLNTTTGAIGHIGPFAGGSASQSFTPSFPGSPSGLVLFISNVPNGIRKVERFLEKTNF